MAKAWLSEALLQATVAGQDQQPFAVGVKTASGIDLGHVNKVAQAPPTAPFLQRELTQDAKGFVKQQRRVSCRFLIT